MNDVCVLLQRYLLQIANQLAFAHHSRKVLRTMLERSVITLTCYPLEYFFCP